MKLSNTTVKNLPIPSGRQVYVYDEQVSAFGVRVSPGGTKSYFVQYRHPDTRRRKRHTIGRVNIMSSDIARGRAKEILARIALGEDPFPVPALTLEAAFAWFLENHLADKSKSYRKLADAVWRNHTPDRLKCKPVEQITRGEWLSVPDRLLADGKLGMSRMSHSIFRAMLNQLERYEMISGSALEKIPPRAEATTRDRVLSMEELVAVWRAGNRLPEEAQIITHTLILTGCRAEEIIGLRSDEVDLDAGVITIGADRVKTRTEHRITLPRRIHAMFQLYGHHDTELFFTPLMGRKVDRQWLLRKLRDATGIKENWRTHDLRRSFPTHLAGLGVGIDIIEMCLNHSVMSRVAATYNRHGYEAERTAALQTWEDELSKLTRSLDLTTSYP